MLTGKLIAFRRSHGFSIPCVLFLLMSLPLFTRAGIPHTPLIDSLVRPLSTHEHSGGEYTRTSDGIVVYPDRDLSGNAAAVKLQVVTDNIIRVLSSPPAATSGGAPMPSQSLITVYATDPSLKWETHTEGNDVTLTTPRLTATVNRSTGAVRFANPSGMPILAEKTAGGRSFEPAIFDGEPFFHIRQTFATDPDEALYGLGQHQDGLINYKGRQVNLFQNNTEIAIPFLLSNKNYGILWDNNGLTTAGDIRPYLPLSSLKLFSAHDEQGWLTTRYRNDKDHPSSQDLEKAESSINYAYLGDTKKQLPAGFNAVNGSVTWEGALASDITGRHIFHFTYGGYLKIWINGVLLLDRWRQAWNPGSAQLPLLMEKNSKYTIRIDWAPDGEESYLTLHQLDPAPEGEKDEFSFRSEAGKTLDYYFIRGNNMDEVIAGYRYLTGKAPIVPKWAMGLWQSRERYKTQEEILSTVKEFRQRKIPLDNIVLDWSYWKQDAWGSQEFDASRFPSPDSMIRTLHQDYHTHFMISVWPKFYENIPAYRTFDEKSWLYKRNVADSQRDWIGKGYVSTFYDAFNPDARKGFWDLLNKKLYNKGIDAWWMDASEPDILSNVSPEKRKEQMTPTALGSAAQWLNAYPLQNARGIYEGQRATNPDQRVFILTRSAFAGSQHYAAAVWSGDIAARWSDMKDQIAAGISCSMSGLPYWTMDIGGFAVEHRYQSLQTITPDPGSLTASGNPGGNKTGAGAIAPGLALAASGNLDEWREQMTRWYQFGAFCPLFRVHGQYPYREIYNVAPENHPAYRSMLYYDRLRYRLMPYLYSLSGMTWSQDYTIMRGLVMDFEKDPAVTDLADEYMFGPDLLIAPVTEYKARSRSLYLPFAPVSAPSVAKDRSPSEGRTGSEKSSGWYDLYSGAYLKGGQTITAAAPYERMPVYVKEGSILPLGPDILYTEEKPADTITLFIYTGKNAYFTLYEDEGANYNYEKGKYTRIPMTWEESTGSLSIGKREGSFDHMLVKRIFRLICITKDDPTPIDKEKAAAPLIRYTGNPVSLKLK